MAEQRPRYVLPARCVYLSHSHFNSSSTRAPPASRDLGSPIHVGVALLKQMRRLTCTSPLKGDSYWGGGTTPEFSQIAVPGLLSSTEVALASNSYPLPQQDRSNTFSSHWEECSDDQPTLRNTEHAHANRKLRRARAHTAGLV